MNKIYKVLWNHSTQNWVVTSELSRGRYYVAVAQRFNRLKTLKSLLKF